MSLHEIFIESIQDLYDAEKQLTKALPRMSKAAKSPELKKAFDDHLRVTEGQVRRIEQVFEALGEKAKSKPCKAMKGLVEEGREIISEDARDGMLDAALIGAAQKIEHYEISGYGTARAIAQVLGHKDAAQLLKQTEQEEGEADKLLTKVAMGLYKQAGSLAEEDDEDQGGNGSRSRGKQGGSSGRGGRTSTRGAAQRGGRNSSARSAGSSSRSASSSSSGSRSSRSNGSRSSRGSSGSGRSSSGGRGASAHPMTDHEEIRQWAEERGATPSCVRGTGGKSDTGMIRLDFPGYSGAQSLQKITWDEWFEKFDEKNLALMVQDTTARGQKSNFNKLVSREMSSSGGSRSRR